MSTVFDRLFGVVETILKAVASVALLLMMALTVVDVVGRYAFNMPLFGSLELTELLMVLLIFAGLPAVSRADAHIKVDLTEGMLSRGIDLSGIFLINLLVIGVLLFLADVVYRKANSLAAYGDGTTLLSIPLAPFAYFMAALLLLSAIAQFMQLVGRFNRELRDRSRGDSR